MSTHSKTWTIDHELEWIASLGTHRPDGSGDRRKALEGYLKALNKYGVDEKMSKADENRLRTYCEECLSSLTITQDEPGSHFVRGHGR